MIAKLTFTQTTDVLYTDRVALESGKGAVTQSSPLSIATGKNIDVSGRLSCITFYNEVRQVTTYKKSSVKNDWGIHRLTSDYAKTS